MMVQTGASQYRPMPIIRRGVAPRLAPRVNTLVPAGRVNALAPAVSQRPRVYADWLDAYTPAARSNTACIMGGINCGGLRGCGSRRRGLGATNPYGAVAGGAMVGTSTALSTGSMVAGAAAGTLAAVAPFTGPAAPFLLAAAALVGPIANLFHGCGATCTQATRIINEATAAANKLRDQYLAQPIHYKSTQVATLQYLNQLMDYVRQACGSTSLGAAGQRCVHENLDRGAVSAWCPAGGCGWPEKIIDPVANDPNVVPDPSPVSQVGSALSSIFGGGSAAPGSLSMSDLLIPALLLGAAVFL